MATTPGVLALDGERTLVIHRHQSIEIEYNARGPYVVDVRAAMRQAAEKRFFVEFNVAPGI